MSTPSTLFTQLQLAEASYSLFSGNNLTQEVPDSMPWILWNSPVKVRPRERAARPGSLREVCGVTQSTKFPDERSLR
jgi:hypothetical protein